jgi:hypothetical protein
MFGRLDGWDESPWLSWEDCKSKFAPALSEITRFQNAYCKRTISMIRENIALYNQWTGRIYVLRKELEGFRKQRAAEWIQQYPIVPLDPRDRLPSNG